MACTLKDMFDTFYFMAFKHCKLSTGFSPESALSARKDWQDVEIFPEIARLGNAAVGETKPCETIEPGLWGWQGSVIASCGKKDFGRDGRILKIVRAGL